MSSELVKLYYRIGEVSSIVGVQPHVLRYWESEFRTIRPQKSNKGQRVYSRRDVERLLFVKDLLKNQGFTIAGAKRRLREPHDATLALSPHAAPLSGAAPLPSVTALSSTAAPVPTVAPVERLLVVPTPSVSREVKVEGKALRRTLLMVREELANWITELEGRAASLERAETSLEH